MKTNFFLVIAAIIALGIFTESFAQMERMRMRGKMLNRMEERLNLTDAQKAKVEELRTNHQKKMIDLKANLEKKRVELRSLRNSDNLNRSDFLKLTKEISEIRNAMAVERANHQMDIYELLDDNQKKIWREMKPEFGMKERKQMKMFRDWDSD
ncbi:MULTISPECIES: Spy/CpxP family protein refolding chaperone [Ignavibacterium]|jgi:Spy/CpxP family protein refolding chaperone|uniref:Spy/CpxP family protein refolding chaperone n=1 Tax=Ignavibacterium TaxID=795750 RepID=UPI0025BD4E8A|nr:MULTISPECIES: Spy/CpxP family protein refolding chaperone [Ignavibacterium]MBI5660865.1 Spy/CpxP family protein refolding chaperone [Ignavibacterium album]